jgi:hypothetical protein
VPTTPDTCGGTCTATKAVGAACDDEVECADDGGTASCVVTAQNPAKHCVITEWRAGGAGAACGAIDTDGDERALGYCTPGLFCKLTLGQTTGTCALPLTVGASCNPSVDSCVTGSLCSGAPGAQTCHEYTVVDHVGGACDEASLIICNPLDRLECVGSVCTTVGEGSVGATCRAGAPTDCDDGLYCEEGGLAGDTCATLVVNGQACTVDSSCASKYCDDVTDPSTPVCAVPQCN